VSNPFIIYPLFAVSSLITIRHSFSAFEGMNRQLRKRGNSTPHLARFVPGDFNIRLHWNSVKAVLLF
jgi:hypothetical protein